MKELISFLAFALVLSILVSPSWAVTIQLTTTPDISGASQDASGNYYVTEGNSFTVELNVLNPSSSSESAASVESTLSLPSGLSTTDSLTKTVAASISPGDSADVSWTVTGDVAGNYLGQIELTTQGTNTAQNEDSTGVLVKLPATIVGGISCSATDSKVIKSGFSVTVTVQNLGDLEASGISISLSSDPSDISISNPKTISSIDGGESGSSTYSSLSSTQTTTYTFTATVTSDNAGSDTAECDAETVNSLPNGYVCTSHSHCSSGCCSGSLCAAASVCDTGNGGSPGGGGGATPPASAKATKQWQVMNAGEDSTMDINNSDIGFTKLRIRVRNQVQSVTMEVESLGEKPSDVTSPSGNAYQYVNVTPTGLSDSDIESATITFRVTKEWVTQNQIDVSTLALERWQNNAWQALTTRAAGADSEYYSFEADTPGFSYFVITGQASAEQPDICNNDGFCDAGEDHDNCPNDCEPGEVGGCAAGAKQCVGMVLQECVNGEWTDLETCEIGCMQGACLQPIEIDTNTLIIIIVIVVAAVVIVVVVVRMRKKKPSSPPKKEEIPVISKPEKPPETGPSE